MAVKSALFLLAFVLLVTQMVSSTSQGDEAPVSSPAAAPVAVPVYDFPAPVTSPRGRKARCFKYCAPTKYKRVCFHYCTACAVKYGCVPIDSECKEWDEIHYHGGVVKCPRISKPY